jgi:hypothetical protein
MARLFNGTVLTALAAGFVGGMLAPVLLPNASKAARPFAKSVIKAGLSAYDRGREQVAEWQETAGDLIAEVQAERQQERQASPFLHPEVMGAAGAVRTDADTDPAERPRYDA